jgi:hypothetical protein
MNQPERASTLERMEISPWADDAVLDSPDGTKTARIVDGHEIGQGSPICGRLVLSTGFELESCSPSMVWSEDSRFLAVQRWRQAGQSLVIIDTVRGEVHLAPGTFRVLQLSAFRGGIVEGIDSPTYEPTQVRVDTWRMREMNNSHNQPRIFTWNRRGAAWKEKTHVAASWAAVRWVVSKQPSVREPSNPRHG